MAASRRSARQAQLQNAAPAAEINSPLAVKPAPKKPNQAPTGQASSASVSQQAENSGAKKRALAEPSHSNGGSKKAKAETQAQTQAQAQAQAQAQDPRSDGDNRLSSLPPEIVNLILGNVRDVQTMSALSRTCKALYSQMMPHLYRRLAVAAMFHAHIPKLIRTIEPHLTLAQKKMLKKEGKYRGQQEEYPADQDEHAKPFCASYVQQLVVGAADPGKKHKYIVLRYIEEAFESFTDLEMVETRVLTMSIAKSLASLKNLKALSLSMDDLENGDFTALAEIKNLKHFSMEDVNWAPTERRKTMQNIIINSMSTLETLSIQTNRLGPDDHLLVDWGKNPALESLRSLDLTSYTVEPGAIQAMQRAIDFTKLTELTLGHFEDEDGTLFLNLASLADSPSGLKLRRLCMSIGDSQRWDATPEHNRVQFEAKCRFISSFSTLESLELRDYGQYSESDNIPNTGLSNTLRHAILKHNNLKTLKISYSGKTSGLAIPYLSAANIRALVGGLSCLEELEFAPEEAQMVEIGKALACATNLSSITCFPHATWASGPQTDDPGMNILRAVVKAFLNRQDPAKSLKTVSVSYRTWQVAPNFPGKAPKGAKKPERMRSDDGSHETLFRDVSGMPPVYIHVGYDPEFAWMEKVGGN